MPARLENYGYGTEWSQVTSDYYEGFSNHMTEYHMHEYFEISLILSGDTKVLLSDATESSDGPKIVLLRPHTPHFIVCDPHTLYRRRNLLFAPQLLADYARDLQTLLPLFGKNGAVIKLEPGACEQLLAQIEAVHREKSAFRQRLLLLCLLSSIGDLAPKSAAPSAVPPLVSKALDFVAEHFGEHLTAEDMAWQLEVGRTTLMTTFKKYTGVTLNQYVAHYRLKSAIAALEQGQSEPEAARGCGFNDACNMIRCFKKYLGKTPMKYLADRR